MLCAFCVRYGEFSKMTLYSWQGVPVTSDTVEKAVACSTICMGRSGEPTPRDQRAARQARDTSAVRKYIRFRSVPIISSRLGRSTSQALPSRTLHHQHVGVAREVCSLQRLCVHVQKDQVRKSR